MYTDLERFWKGHGRLREKKQKRMRFEAGRMWRTGVIIVVNPLYGRIFGAS